MSFNPVKYVEKTVQYFRTHPLRHAIIDWSKKHSFPGFQKVPVYDVVNFVGEEMKRDDLNTRANGIAFSFFLSLFPLILVLFSLIAYLPIYKNFFDLIKTSIQEIMPGNAGKMLLTTIRDIITKKRSDLLSLGFILAMFFSTNGMMAMMKGFEKSYPFTFRKIGPIQKRLTALQLTFMLALLLLASVILIILGNTIVNLIDDWFDIGKMAKTLIFYLRWAVIIFLFYGGISVIYRYGAPTRKRFGFFSPGAGLATFLSMLTSLGFSFYVDNFGNYNKLYGSIGTIIVVMVWLQINSFVILVGYELNASIAVNRDLKNRRRMSVGD